jgi:8-oxo-dGTP pyrophosphatase MutT (NUDIX family)
MRELAAFPAAVLVLLVDEEDRALLLRKPGDDAWQVVNGAMEAGETVLHAARRETHEEAGPAVRVRPVGVLHTMSFVLEGRPSPILSVVYLFAYEGGPVEPGDDMEGSEHAFVALDELANGAWPMEVPRGQPWLYERARLLMEWWRQAGRRADLERELEPFEPVL